MLVSGRVEKKPMADTPRLENVDGGRLKKLAEAMSTEVFLMDMFLSIPINPDKIDQNWSIFFRTGYSV